MRHLAAMPQVVLTLADVVLALGMIARLTRLVVVDSLGGKWFRWPAQHWANRGRDDWHKHRRQFWVDGLACPFCVSTWIGIGSFALLFWVWWLREDGHGWPMILWRIVTAGLTASFVLAHLLARLGDVNDDIPEGEPEPVDHSHPDAYAAAHGE